MFRHFETTSHTFTLQLGGNLVWDYAGDNYVHRLIQSSTDGKMVEYQGSEDVCCYKIVFIFTINFFSKRDQRR